MTYQIFNSIPEKLFAKNVRVALGIFNGDSSPAPAAKSDEKALLQYLFE
jgi:hypothetical protein